MFGNRLKDLRTKNGYSMDRLIEVYNSKYSAKMNKSTLSRYENGLQEPIYTVVVNLADFFGVSVDYLSGGESTIEEIATDTEYKKADALSDIYLKIKNNPTFYKLVEKLYELNDQQLEAVYNMLSTFEQH